jgi:hypothetical protein
MYQQQATLGPMIATHPIQLQLAQGPPSPDISCETDGPDVEVGDQSIGPLRMKAPRC